LGAPPLPSKGPVGGAIPSAPPSFVAITACSPPVVRPSALSPKGTRRPLTAVPWAGGGGRAARPRHGAQGGRGGRHNPPVGWGGGKLEVGPLSLSQGPNMPSWPPYSWPQPRHAFLATDSPWYTSCEKSGHVSFFRGSSLLSWPEPPPPGGGCANPGQGVCVCVWWMWDGGEETPQRCPPGIASNFFWRSPFSLSRRKSVACILRPSSQLCNGEHPIRGIPSRF